MIRSTLALALAGLAGCGGNAAPAPVEPASPAATTGPAADTTGAAADTTVPAAETPTDKTDTATWRVTTGRVGQIEVGSPIPIALQTDLGAHYRPRCIADGEPADAGE